MCSFTGCGVPRRLGLMLSAATTSLLSLVSFAAAGAAAAAQRTAAASNAISRGTAEPCGSRQARVMFATPHTPHAGHCGRPKLTPLPHRRETLHLLLVRL